VPLNLNFTHLMVVAFVALVVLGPDRLPGVARTAGNLYREWRRISGNIEAEVRDAISEFTEPFAEPIQDLIHPEPGSEVPTAATGGLGPVAAGPVATGPGPGPDGAATPLDTLPPLGQRAAGRADGPLTPAIPALGPGTGLVSPGPVHRASLPELGPPADPRTFVPFEPEHAGHRPA